LLKINVIGNLGPKLKRLEQKQSRLLANDIFRSVKDLTPVDTGRAKRNWRLLKRRFGYIINNTVPYIGVLDAGRGLRAGQMRGSKQAPRGMTKPTFERLRARNKIK